MFNFLKNKKIKYLTMKLTNEKACFSHSLCFTIENFEISNNLHYL